MRHYKEIYFFSDRKDLDIIREINIYLCAIIDRMLELYPLEDSYVGTTGEIVLKSSTEKSQTWALKVMTNYRCDNRYWLAIQCEIGEDGNIVVEAVEKNYQTYDLKAFDLVRRHFSIVKHKKFFKKFLGKELQKNLKEETTDSRKEMLYERFLRDYIEYYRRYSEEDISPMKYFKTFKITIQCDMENYRATIAEKLAEGLRVEEA